MRKLILFFLFLLAAVWIGIKISADPGYVLISYQHWSLETTLWFAVLALLIFYFLLYFLIRLFRGSLAVSGKWRIWSRKRRLRKAHSLTSRGLCQLAEGEWRAAERTLNKSASKTDTPLINFLAAARAAQGQGAYERRDTYLKQAIDNNKKAEVAVGLTQAELQLNSKQLEQALATLKHLNQLVPHHTYVLNLLRGVYLELYDWDGLASLLPELRKRKVLKPEALATLERKVYLQLLQSAASVSSPTLETTWHNVPKHLTHDPELVASYAQLLIDNDNGESAEEILRTTIKKNSTPSLIRLYGISEGKNPSKQLSTAEAWLKGKSTDSNLLLALGRICVQNRLWGKAQSYLEASAKIEPTAETYFELGKILEQLGEMQGALGAYRKGLSLVAG